MANQVSISLTGNTVTVTETESTVVSVSTIGPQGPIGPAPNTSSFIQTSQTSSMSVGTATNADNAYVDFGATNSSYRIPMVTGTPGDGYFQLKSPSNEIYYYLRLTNPVSGVSQQADQLNIGGGSNTAGGIFLNSTTGIPSFMYSDGPLHLYSVGYKVDILSTDKIAISGSTYISGSLNTNDTLVFSNLPTDEPATTGQLWLSGSTPTGNSGYLVVKK